MVFNRWHQCASPPNTSFLGPNQVHNPNGISIGSAIFAQLTAECHRACLGMSCPLKIAPRMGQSEPNLVHGSWGPTCTYPQMASRLVQPCFCTAHRRVSVSFIIGRHFPLKIAPPITGYGLPCNTWFPGSIRLHNSNGILIASTVFAGLTTVTDQQTTLLGL